MESEDGEKLVGRHASAETPQDVQETVSSEERYKCHNLREGEEDGPTHQEGRATAEYVIDRIVGHGFQEEKLILNVG